MIWLFQTGYFSSPSIKARITFSSIFTVETWLNSRTWNPQNCGLPFPSSLVFNSQICHTDPRAILPLLLILTFPGIGSKGDWSLWFSAQVSCDFLYPPASQFWRQWYALWPYFSSGSKKNCWFFTLFNFLFIGKMMTSKFFLCQFRKRKSGCLFLNVWVD